MGFFSRKGISYKSIFYFVLSIWLCRSDGEESDFKIYRGQRDIFTNLEYDVDGTDISSASGSTDQCSSYDAECVDNDKCDYCRCLEGKNTFMINDDGHMEGCTGDEEIVPESVPEDKFWLKNSVHKECLKLDGSSNNYVIGTSCSSPTLSMFWIWTSTGNKQLINVKTLKCMERGRREELIMKQCENTKDKQKIQCAEHGTGYEMEIEGNGNRFLHLPQSRSRVIFERVNNEDPQLWSSEEQTPCETSTAYNGCYRFSDGSFMKYLDYSIRIPAPKLRISAPIFKNDSGRCRVSNKFNYSRDNYTGESDTGNVFKIRRGSKIIELKFTTMEQFKAWNGSLLKLSVVCGTEEHCVLLKLASKPSYSEVINSTPTPSRVTRTEEESTTLSTETTTGYDQDSTSEVLTTPKTSTKGKPLEGRSEEALESGGTNSTAIAVIVTLLLVALAFALGFLVYYRRRKRAQVSQNNNNGLGVVNYSSGIYEGPERIYETLKDDENAVSYHQPGPSSDTYSYPDGNIIANPPSIEQEYTYAKETAFPRSSVATKPEPKEQIDNGVVYETIEQPGQPNNDGFYNYPENTNITKPPASELEYTYAKDTDISRVTIDKTAVPGEHAPNAVYHTLEQEQPPITDVYKLPGANIPTELEYTYAKNTEIPRITTDGSAKGDGVPATSTSDAVYHTLEQEVPASNEHEYSYVKNTDIPSIPLGTQQRNEHSAPPNDSGLYHTLEESNPPQPPVYSTLEGPDDVDNYKQVTDERPSSSDHTYIDVIEHPNKADC